MRITKSMYDYFQGHPETNEFFFTSDGSARFNMNAANNHAAALAKNGGSDEVMKLTRAEAIAWWKEHAPNYAAECREAVLAADEAVQAATKYMTGLPANTPPAKKALAQRVINDAMRELDAAKKELALAEADAAQAGELGAGAGDQGFDAGAGVGAQVVIIPSDSDELKTAKQAYNDAVAAKASLPADAGAKAKGDATKAVNAAKKVLDGLMAL